MRRFFTPVQPALEVHTVSETRDSVKVGDVDVVEEQNNSLMTQVVEAVTIAEALESLSIVLEEVSEDSGLDKTNASLLKISLEHFYSVVGCRTDKESEIALTSLINGSATSNSEVKHVTQLALEDIKEKITEIWEAIVKAIKKSIEWVKEIYNRIFNNTDNVKDRAEKLLKELESGESFKKEEVATEWIDDKQHFDDETIFKNLQRNGDCEKVGVGVKELIDLSEAVLKPSSSAVDALVTAFDSGDIETFQKYVDKAVGGFGNENLDRRLIVVKDPAAEGFPVYENTEFKRSIELFGGFALVKRTGITDDKAPPTADSVHDKLSSYSMRIEHHAPVKHRANYSKVRIASVSEIIDIVKGVIIIINSINDYKPHAEKIDNAKKKLVEVAETYSRDRKKQLDQATLCLRKIAPIISKLLDQPQTSFNIYTLHACDHLMEYATVCSNKHR
jgi:hypothetical protein